MISFTDTFDSFHTSTWAREYTCPAIGTGKARFRLTSGVSPDNYGSWSKAGYEPARFTEGKFTVSFSLAERPKDKAWRGVALRDDKQGSEQGYGNTQLQHIPTDAMDLILGPRLVTGGQLLTQGFTESVDPVEIAPVG